MFQYRFQVGNALQAAQESELRIVAERHFDEVHLFLDPASMVDDLVTAAGDRISTNVGVAQAALAGGAIRTIPAVQWQRHAGGGGGGGGTLPGVTVVLPAGTEIGLAPTLPAGAAALRLRFPVETRIEVGSRGHAALERLGLRGLAPVTLDGLPLLEVTGRQEASLRLSWGAVRSAVLSLLVIVSPYRGRGQDALYHVVEAVGGRVVGGSSLQIRA